MSQRKAVLFIATMSVTWAVTGAVAGSAAAQPNMPREETPGRYSMKETDEGFLRLDTATGIVSLCEERLGSWSCQVVPDDREMYRDEMTALIEENNELRRQLAAAMTGESLPPESNDNQTSSAEDVLPSDEEIDQAFDSFEGLADRMVGLVGKLKEKFEGMEEETSPKPPVQGEGI